MYGAEDKLYFYKYSTSNLPQGTSHLNQTLLNLSPYIPFLNISGVDLKCVVSESNKAASNLK